MTKKVKHSTRAIIILALMVDLRHRSIQHLGGYNAVFLSLSFSFVPEPYFGMSIPTKNNNMHGTSGNKNSSNLQLHHNKQEGGGHSIHMQGFIQERRSAERL